MGLSFDGSSNGYSGWNTIDTGISVQEYEVLTVETYWESRVITTRFDNGKHPFSYVHCKKTHLLKNMTSYHSMFNQCKVYKVTVVLKIYPTWEKSNPEELHIIAKKYEKVYHSSIVCKPSAPVKRKTTDNIEFHPPKQRNLAVKTILKPPKSPSWNKPRRRTKAVIQLVKFEEPQQADDTE
jgi:hypothetical protein